ncbi:MAG: amino acid adenylation domain-containing protein [Bacteroidota bacterium]
MPEQSNLKKWLASKRKKAESSNQIVRPDKTLAPLSGGQRQMWLLYELNPQSTAYHFAESYLVSGPLNTQKLVEAYQLVVKRHDILRTVFRLVDGERQQVVLAEAKINYHYLDYSSRQNPLANAREQLKEEAAKPFDLEEGPTNRLWVAKVNHNQHLIMLALHHMLMDHQSMQILRKEWAANYQELTAGFVRPRESLKVQYGDYAYRQKIKTTPDHVIDFWRDKLVDSLDCSQLPTDYSPKTHFSYKGGFKSKRYPTDKTAELYLFLQNHACTLYQLFVVAFKIVLWQRSSQGNISIGSPVSNRNKAELDEVIGYFNDTIVLIDKLDGNDTFIGFLDRFKSNFLESFAHKDVPFDELVKKLKPKREPGRNPYFQHMVVMQKAPPLPDFGEHLEIDYNLVDLDSSKFELTLFVSEQEDGITLQMEYATDLFEEATVARIIDQVIHVVSTGIGQPELILHDFPKLSIEEGKKLQNWQTTSHYKATSFTVVDDSLTIARHNPEAVAASYLNESLSYNDLNNRSADLAQRLLAEGLRPGELVGLHVDRSLNLLVGIWGILRAGGAYLPMDPEYPTDRLLYMVEDAQLRLVVGQDSSTIVWPGGILFVDIESNTEIAKSEPLPEISASQPAYLIYTSGSSGKPKGVLVRHRELYYSTQARQLYYSENPRAFLLLSSFSFDSSVAGIFWTTTTGGELVIAPRRIEQDLSRLAEIIEERKVSQTLLLPSLYEAMLQFLPIEQLASLKAIIVAGEACPGSLIGAHFKHLPEAKLYNEYGPTEATVWCSVAELIPKNQEGEVPIGRPIPGSELLILDEHGKQQPIGVPGELYVGGPGLAAGYWHREELNNKRFVNHPFKDEQKLYRTGDLAKWRNDGQIDFMGRADDQVKVRGYRIELDEVASAVRVCLTNGGELALGDGVVSGSPDSRVQKQVVAHVNDSGQLVAYIAGTFDEKTIRAKLTSQLPAYMVPTYYVQLDEIPHLPNGKIDRNALPSPKKPSAETASKSVDISSLSPIEAKLLEIWQEVLGIPAISLQDNFFEIGGDSISSIQIVGRAREAGISLAPTAIFEHQSIGQLALFANADSKKETSTRSDSAPGALLPIQHWFFEEHRQAPHFWNQGYELTLAEKNTRSYWERILPAEVQKHPILSIGFKMVKGSYRIFQQEAANDGLLSIWDFSEMSPDEQSHELQQRLYELQDDADLDSDEIFRAILIERGTSQPDSLILLAHHLVVDAVSWTILLREIEIGYKRLNSGQDLELHRPERTYFEWANQLEMWAANNNFIDDLAFWQAQESKGFARPAQGNLPSSEDRSTTRRKVYSDTRLSALQSDAHRAFNTKTEDILLSALLLCFYRSWGQKSLCVQIEHNGRAGLETDVDFSQGIGWFTSSYPLLFELDGLDELDKSVRKVKETLRSVPNSGLSYGVLRYLNKATDLQQKPELFFNYLGTAPSGSNESAQMITTGMRHADSERNRRLEVNLWLIDDKLYANWTFDAELEKASGLVNVIDLYPELLFEIIDFCLQTEDQQYSPSDFPDADLSQGELDDLLGQLDL